MSYNTDNPPALVGQRVGAAGAALWMYKDGDSLDDVGDIDYIKNANDLGMLAGDKVCHIDTTDLVTNDLTVNAHHTIGTMAGALCSATEAAAETSIALQSAGTGSILIDDIIYFSNDRDSLYRVTTGDSDVSGGGTLVITPGLVTGVTSGVEIFIKSGVLNLATAKTGRRVHASSPATRLLQPSESGDLFLFDTATGQVFTLPTAVIGLKYSFLVTVALDSNAYAVLTSTSTAGDFMIGYCHNAVEGAATDEVHFADGAADLGISMNKTTTGGLVGTIIELECVSAVLWKVKATALGTGSPATPFTT